jgi:hypothetical protein
MKILCQLLPSLLLMERKDAEDGYYDGYMDELSLFTSAQESSLLASHLIIFILDLKE